MAGKCVLATRPADMYASSCSGTSSHCDKLSSHFLMPRLWLLQGKITSAGAGGTAIILPGVQLDVVVGRTRVLLGVGDRGAPPAHQSQPPPDPEHVCVHMRLHAAHGCQHMRRNHYGRIHPSTTDHA